MRIVSRLRAAGRGWDVEIIDRCCACVVGRSGRKWRNGRRWLLRPPGPFPWSCSPPGRWIVLPRIAYPGKWIFVISRNDLYVLFRARLSFRRGRDSLDDFFDTLRWTLLPGIRSEWSSLTMPFWSLFRHVRIFVTFFELASFSSRSGLRSAHRRVASTLRDDCNLSTKVDRSEQRSERRSSMLSTMNGGGNSRSSILFTFFAIKENTYLG